MDIHLLRSSHSLVHPIIAVWLLPRYSIEKNSKFPGEKLWKMSVFPPIKKKSIIPLKFRTSKRQALAKNPAAIAFLTTCKMTQRKQWIFHQTMKSIAQVYVSTTENRSNANRKLPDNSVSISSIYMSTLRDIQSIPLKAWSATL